MAENENIYATYGAANLEAQGESSLACTAEDFSKVSEESGEYEPMTYSTVQGEPVNTTFMIADNIYSTTMPESGAEETPLPREGASSNADLSSKISPGMQVTDAGREKGGRCVNKMWIVTAFVFIIALAAVCAATVLSVKMAELTTKMTELMTDMEIESSFVRANLQQLNHSIDQQISQHENRNSELFRQLTADTQRAINESYNATFQELTLLRNGISDKLSMLRNKTLLLNETVYEQNDKLLSLFFNSCAALSPSSSGYYFLRASNGSVVHVYCNMDLQCGNITGGWMRVAELNMTDTSQQCPSGGLIERVYNDVRQCRIGVGVDCSSTNYSTANLAYSRICGRITAYQVGTTNAFHRRSPSNSANLNFNYVDGVSLTHGTPREHIWTFASALDKGGNFTPSLMSYCPCQNISSEALNDIVPSFVGHDYFCDSGSEEYDQDTDLGLTHYGDPLWDGTDCLCCDNPPWFYKQLTQPTTNNIEMRVCRDEDGDSENIAIQSFEIYVQ